MNEIVEKVRAFAQENKLFAPGQRLCAAVSGGADSMALLRLLLRIQPVFGYELTACHVNHGLRGEPADRDEAFVRAECARLNVPLRVFHPADVGAAVPAHPGEDWARKLRYACFDALRAGGIDAVATAHTATDQTETLLFRLARGAGLHGAAGIRPSRPGFCRPLLCLTRAETEQVCTACGQRWVTDETNASDAYARNRLRHAALPALRSVNEAAEENFARFCEKAARADAYFAQRAEELLEDAEVLLPPALPAGARYALQSGRPVWGLEGLQEADPLILEAALHSLVAPVRDAEEKYIRLLCTLVEQGSGAVQLTGSVRFCAGGGVLWVEKMPAAAAPDDPAAAVLPLPFDPAGLLEIALPGGWMLAARQIPGGFQEKTQGVHKKDLKNQADYAKINSICPVLRLRCRQPGDRFRPAGRGVDRELRKWMNEAGIPPRERDTLPLLAAGRQVLWVCGEGFADGLAPGPDTGQLLQVELENFGGIES